MKFGTVIFDCDSTLSALEGIEALAREHQAEVARLTDLAMNGQVPLEQVYGRRLDLIRPTREAVAAIGRLYVERVVPGAATVVETLHREGIVVQILSGGLTPAVAVLAAHLGIARERVAAVDLRFTAAGEYAGFDEASPLTRAGGKRHWVESQGRSLPRPILLVGDGATDLEARPAVDAFAAFTGVVARPEVVRGADFVVGPALTPLVEIILGRI